MLAVLLVTSDLAPRSSKTHLSAISYSLRPAAVIAIIFIVVIFSSSSSLSCPSSSSSSLCHYQRTDQQSFQLEMDIGSNLREFGYDLVSPRHVSAEKKNLALSGAWQVMSPSSREPALPGFDLSSAGRKRFPSIHRHRYRRQHMIRLSLGLLHELGANCVAEDPDRSFAFRRELRLTSF